MSDSKSIKIDDRFFRTAGSGGNSSTRKVRKSKPSSENVSASSLRKALLVKLKLKHSEEAKQSRDKLKSIVPNTDQTVPVSEINENRIPSEGQFKGALDYLNNLVDKRKKDRRDRYKNKSVAQNSSEIATARPKQSFPVSVPSAIPVPQLSSQLSFDTEVATSLPPSLAQSLPPYLGKDPQVAPPPPRDTLKKRPSRRHHRHRVLTSNLAPPPAYSNLKTGGSRPTYRQLHNTTLKHISRPLKLAIRNSTPNDIIRHEEQLKDEIEAPVRMGRRKIRKIKRTMSRTFKLGKRGNKVGVLLKDGKTRRKINEEHGKLRKKSIKQVRQYLRDRNLIRAGTTMPNEVARTIFINSVLTGDVHNRNDKLALHNFTHKDDTL